MIACEYNVKFLENLREFLLHMFCCLGSLQKSHQFCSRYFSEVKDVSGVLKFATARDWSENDGG